MLLRYCLVTSGVIPNHVDIPFGVMAHQLVKERSYMWGLYALARGVGAIVELVVTKNP